MHKISIFLFITFALGMVYTQDQYTKLLVATGSIVADFARKSEVIDLAEGKTCEPLEDFPFGTMDATGGLLNGHYPVICGGYVRQRPTTGQCAVLGSPDEEISMVQTRDTASSIMINPSVLWITGGKHFVEGIPVAIDLKSTEYLSLADGSPSGPGPDLPIHVWGHCLFAKDESGVILSGGVSREHYSSARTYMFDSASGSWTEAPKMNIDRYMHGCATFKNQGKTYAVVAGGYSIVQGGMSSVEFLSLDDEGAGWTEGPSMPRELMEFSLMTSPDGDGVLAVGGISGSDFQASILKMTCHSLNCEWTELDQKLEVARKSQVAFLIPDDLTTCE